MPGRPAPIAHVLRSGFVESVHHGHAVALGGDGAVVVTTGAPEEPVFARSCLKPLFAAAMVRAGLDVPAHLLALAQSSHSGEAYHLDGVRRLLAVAGLDVTDLRNTGGAPLDPDEAARWRVEGRGSTRLAQNCSGKHAAMLVTCAVNGWDRKTYFRPEHPLQVLLRDAVEDLAGEPVAVSGVDGCGAVVHAVSLTGLARAFARIAAAPAGTPEGRVAEANRRHPEWVGGTGRYVTELVRAVPGLVAKDGAEAVCAAGLPDGRAVAVKVSDGAERPLRPVLAALITALLPASSASGGERSPASPALERFARAPVFGHGVPVGAVVPLPRRTPPG
ncbi:MAG: asparaginase [Kineosporiaceae bacterium]